MAYIFTPLRLLPLLVLSVLLCTRLLHAQTQKWDSPSQKGLRSEQLNQEQLNQEQLNKGGYQAPPATGALQGPTREYGLSTGEIELPAIRLRLPRIRFPSLSMFMTGPQMHTNPGIAPLVEQVVEHVSVPAGSNGDGPETEAFTAPPAGDDPYQKQPYQKVSHCMCHECRQPVHRASRHSDTTYFREFEARERALESRIQELQSALELLLANQQVLMDRNSSMRNDVLTRIPDVAPVRYSHYLRRVPAPPNGRRRLPSPTN
jgi:hypothetical protein